MNTQATAEEFAVRLKTLRESLGLSQEQFAELVGVKRVSQYLYEVGDRLPTLEYLFKAHKAGIDVVHLLMGTQVEPSGHPRSRIPSKDQFVAMYSVIEALAVDRLGRPLPFEKRRKIVGEAYEILTKPDNANSIRELRARIKQIAAGT